MHADIFVAHHQKATFVITAENALKPANVPREKYQQHLQYGRQLLIS
jgi:hypothetical protein